ncbi:MAG TPA: GtrA family protein [Candidatus Saccharimonadales bacterium]|nr:GtrA family protein [Candidatus Saccharimonadales bacterium]
MELADFRPTRSNIIQFLEYLVGGTVYFWSGYLIFAICYSGLGWNWLPAKLIADAIGWTLNYAVQRYWAFDNPNLRRHELETAGKYAGLTVFNLALDYLIIWGLASLGVSPYVGFFISAGFFTVWNYLWYRFWVFYQKRKYTGVEV